MQGSQPLNLSLWQWQYDKNDSWTSVNTWFLFSCYFILSQSYHFAFYCYIKFFVFCVHSTSTLHSVRFRSGICRKALKNWYGQTQTPVALLHNAHFLFDSTHCFCITVFWVSGQFRCARYKCGISACKQSNLWCYDGFCTNLCCANVDVLHHNSPAYK